MGFLRHFDVVDIALEHGLVAFVETGTCLGDGLAHAAESFPFRWLAACEIDPALAADAVLRFQDDSRIEIVTARSWAFLESTCRTAAPDEPILFWLDAHYPWHSYTAEPNESIRLPLQGELEIIRDLRPAGKDVILIDDIRIYLDGPFTHGNSPPEAMPVANRSANFLKTTLAATHDCTISFEHEGYAMLAPKRR